MLFSHLDNMLTVSDISTHTALLLPSAFRMINEHSAPLWSPLLMKHLVSSVYTSLILPHDLSECFLSVLFFAAQKEHSAEEDQLNAAQKRWEMHCTATS